MKIPFVDLKQQYATIKDQIDTAINDVISECAFIRGKYVEEFEANFAEFCQATYCTGVGNGTDAITIALKAMGIGQGDEVILPANSFIATSEAVTNAGAQIVFVDVDEKTYNINPELIEEKITENTKAIIPVHLYGQPADLEAIRAIADVRGLLILQDSAQAHGAKISDKPLIEFGDVLTFSFYPGKNLGAYGDAGAIVTSDQNLAKKIKMIANHGRIEKYNHEIEGYNSRMDGIQGAVLNVKLKYLSQWNERRIRNAKFYNEALAGIKGVTTPYVASENRHVFHLYVIRSTFRDQLQSHLKQNNVASGIHYPIALPNLNAYKHLGHTPADFPIASEHQELILSLPMFPELTIDMIEYIAESIDDFVKHNP